MAKKYLDDNGLLYFWGKLKAAFLADVSWDSSNKKLQKTKNGSTSDIISLATIFASPALTGTPTAPTASSSTDSTQIATTAFVHDVVDALDTGVSDVTVDGTSVVSSGVAAIVLTGKVDTSSVGAASGVCPLNASSKIDTTYLPSYVDDVIEAYPVSGATELSAGWLSATSGGSALTPETGKIYVLMSDTTSYSANSQFRWGGTAYVKLADGGVTAITNAEIDVIVAA